MSEMEALDHESDAPLLAEIQRLHRRLEREREARHDAERLAQQATRVSIEDPLTGLANRNLLISSLTGEMARASHYKRDIALLYIDLDRFKLVNDTYGHDAGDAALCSVADVLRNTSRENDLVGRIGSDEFLVIAPDISEPDATRLAGRIVAAIERVQVATAASTPCSASIGVAMLGDDTNLSVDDYVRQADTAMYAAKSAGADLRVFDDELEDRTERTRLIRRAMPIAIAERQFVLHYQPIIDTRDNRIVALEAMIRWPREDGSVLPPSEFIPVAEADGQIVHLGRLAAELAMADLATYREEHGDVPISICLNASPQELVRSDYTSQLAFLVAEHDADPADLVIEVTESTLQEGGPLAERNLRALRRMGVRTALDDFGTGYSSLGRLRQHDFDVIKIDRNFVAGAADHADDRAVVSSVVSLADVFDVDVVAAGVETAAQLNAVTELGCRGAQGWFFARAVPIGSVGPPDQFM